MTTTMLILIVSASLVLAVSLPAYLRERRLLRVARAKLEICRTVTAMEELMLSGKLTMGEVCHDKIYKTMLAVQSSDKYYVPWKLWRLLPSSEEREFRDKLHAEITMKGSDVGKLLGKFTAQYFRAYNYSRPWLTKLFCIWVVCFAFGFIAAVLAARKYRSFKAGCDSLHRVAAEWLLAITMESAESSDERHDLPQVPDMVR